MITKADIAALWLEACPSFRPAFSGSCADNGEELLYVHAGVFADHLLALHRSGHHDDFPAVSAFIERLHTEGDHYTREFATIGILESIQNSWGWSEVSPEQFFSFLQPVSAAAWQSLNQFWAGEIPVVPDPLQDDRNA